MARFDAIDLSQLPMPDVLQALDFDVELKALRDQLVEMVPEIEGIIDLESEPARKLLELYAYLVINLVARVNDAARAVMLPFATGTDLDNLAVFYATQRLLGETDARFRARVQLAPEAMSVAGPEGAYIYHALKVDPNIKDVSVYQTSPGVVKLTVMMAGENPVPTLDMLADVDAALSAEDVRPLTDDVQVAACVTKPVAIDVKIKLYPGPSSSAVSAAAQTAINAYLASIDRLGYDLTLSGLYAAAHQAGVYGVEIVSPTSDVIVNYNEVVSITSKTVTVVGVDT